MAITCISLHVLYLNDLHVFELPMDCYRYFVIHKSSLERLMFQYNFAIILVYTFKLKVSLLRKKIGVACALIMILIFFSAYS